MTSSSEFMEELRLHRSDPEVSVALHIIEWATDRGLREEFGARVPSKGVPYWPRIPHLEGRQFSPFQMWTKSSEGVTMQYGYLRKVQPFTIESRRKELRDRIDALPGIDPKPEWPSVTLAALTDERVLKDFLDLSNWIIERLEKANRQSLE